MIKRISTTCSNKTAPTQATRHRPPMQVDTPSPTIKQHGQVELQVKPQDSTYAKALSPKSVRSTHDKNTQIDEACETAQHNSSNRIGESSKTVEQQTRKAEPAVQSTKDQPRQTEIAQQSNTEKSSQKVTEHNLHEEPNLEVHESVNADFGNPGNIANDDFYDCESSSEDVGRDNLGETVLHVEPQSGTSPHARVFDRTIEDSNATERNMKDTLSCNRPNEVIFVGSSETDAQSNALSLIQSTTPISQFPLSSELVWSKSSTIKAGTMCTVAWTFARQVTLNISLGKVTRVSKRGSKNIGKIFLKYQGVHGHKAGEEFNGFLPAQQDVRIYKILWHCAPPPIDEIEPIPSDEVDYRRSIGADSNEAEADVDHLPIPTTRIFSADFIPSVVAIYRDIICMYSSSDHSQRSRIWNRTLSAMKLSLATVHKANFKQRKRRPFHQKDEQQETMGDTRAVKRATRLVLEGNATKAAKVMD